MRESDQPSAVAGRATTSAEPVCDGESSPKRGKGLRLISRLAGAATLGTLAYTLLVRPWHLRWGATEEEATGELPGDDLLEQSRMQTTRAITIDASPAEIWPWLVQMGQGRGGLYSYDWLENLVGCDIHSAGRIIPELQHLQVGDRFRLGPENYPYFIVTSIVPERELVLAAGMEPRNAVPPGPPAVDAEYLPKATWAFVLRPLEEGRTRLVIRFRSDWSDDAGMTLFNRAILEPAHFVMERKMIYGIKERAEGSAAA